MHMCVTVCIYSWTCNMTCWLTCFSDNPDVDIYGANLFNRTLQKKLEIRREQEKRKLQKTSASSSPASPSTSEDSTPEPLESWDGDKYLPDDQIPMEANHIGAESCESILVCTGVYSASRDYVTQNNKREMLLHHNHRDFIMDQNLRKPSVIVHNVHEAVQCIFEKEGLASVLRNREGLS